ncbi:MAG: O-antigen ligase family protein [Verrucomicrobiota bacterium]
MKSSSGTAKSSLFANLTASRATVVLKSNEKPIFVSHLIALVGIAILILLGGSHNLFALSWALLLPGVWLLLRPPEFGYNRALDYAVLAFLALQLFAFLPQIYWQDASWKETAVDSFGIEFPFILSMQPGRSLDAWVTSLAGIAWFYLLLSFPVNPVGRKWIHFWVSIVIGVFAAVVLWGNLRGIRYFGAEEATAFTFFPNRNQTTNLMAVGGVFTFGFGLEGFRRRKLVNIAGLTASALCLGALIMGVSRAGILLYFVGILIWFICRRWRSSIRFYIKIGLPILLLFFSFLISSNQKSVSRISDFLMSPTEWDEAFRASVYRDSLEMIMDAPLTGVGVGNFEAVFPQYREESRNYQRVAHPESDYLWVATEGGLLLLVALLGILFIFFRSCRGLSEGKGGSYRVAALAATIVFILHSLVDVSGHRPGTAYFALFVAALTLPMRGVVRPKLPKLLTRLVGLALMIYGAFWLFIGVSGQPSKGEAELVYLTEQIDRAIQQGDFEKAHALVERRIGSRPMDWQGYFQRAQLTLAESGNLSAAALDFRRARFVEPVLAAVSYDEGFVWLPYDYGRAISAWRKTLNREAENMDNYYGRIIRAGRGDPDFLNRIAQLSETSLHYRHLFLLSLRGETLMAEIERELVRDPSLSQFSTAQREEILDRWIDRGDLVSAQAYLDLYADELPDVWWLRALLYEAQAKFEPAVETVRKHLEPALIPEVPFEVDDVTRIERAYALTKSDIVKGTALLKFYLANDDIIKALDICESLSEGKDPPAYALYWRAELLYRLNDIVESWYSFEKYIQLYR